MPTHSAIYAIININSDYHYIGSALKVNRRRYEHWSTLRANTHYNEHLQRSWCKDGEDSFIFVTLEVCWSFQLIEREQWWIDNLKPEYNILSVAGSRLGAKHSEETKLKQSISNTGKKRSLETRAKQSTIGKLRIFTDQHKINLSKSNANRQTKEETKLKISLATKGKIKERYLDFYNWPHEKGSLCRCNECKLVANERKSLRRKIQRTK